MKTNVIIKKGMYDGYTGTVVGMLIWGTMFLPL